MYPTLLKMLFLLFDNTLMINSPFHVEQLGINPKVNSVNLLAIASRNRVVFTTSSQFYTSYFLGS